MTIEPTVIVLAQSARAIAASAKRAGFAPLAVDVFGDEDMRETCLAAITLDGGLSAGLTESKVSGAVETLIRSYRPIGLVYGSGFERQPETISLLAGKTRIYGNSAETLRRVKDPCELARFCLTAEISHPPIAFATPEKPEDWLLKTRGGAGGTHVVRATRGRLSPDCYYQRHVEGESISALFVADGRKAAIIGFSRQWTSPTPEAPFRYGGAVGPIENFGGFQADEIARSVACVVSEMRLVGINSADFIVSGEAVWLLEINPRPGATLDILEPDERTLFEIHVAACDGRLPTVQLGSEYRAAKIVYASVDMAMADEPRVWPEWTADRPPPGTCFMAGDPICTVLASGPTASVAQSLVEARAEDVVAFVQRSKP